MSWTLATVALAVLAVAAVSRRLSGGPLTPAIAFVALGLLAGPRVFDEIDVTPDGAPFASSPRRRSRWCCSPTPPGSTCARCAVTTRCRYGCCRSASR
jgi:hypothetical protein